MADLLAEEDQGTNGAGTIGDRLRTAREKKGIALEEIARQTRIPIRHLEHIERSEWDALPAVTYSVGFARSYASAVGLNAPAIGAELREELGATRTYNPTQTAHYEPADPARVPPRWIAIIAALLAAALIAGYLFWRSGAVEDDPAETAIIESQAPPAAGPGAAGQPTQAAPAPPPATGPVVLTATEEVWLRVYQPTGPKLFEGILQPGQRYEVPAGAEAPMILTGRPQALQVTVGGRPIPPLGEPERTISDVSLRAADLVARTQAGRPAAQQPGTQPGAAAPAR